MSLIKPISNPIKAVKATLLLEIRKFSTARHEYRIIPTTNSPRVACVIYPIVFIEEKEGNGYYITYQGHSKHFPYICTEKVPVLSRCLLFNDG
jgi:hypothetical protein